MKLRLRIQRSLCIVQLLLTPTAVVSDVPRAPFVPTTTVMTTTTTTTNTDDRSTVLRELKETIRQQATEINSLHKQLKSIGIIPSDATKTKHLAVVPTNLHGGGGATSAAMDDMTQYLHRPFYYIASQRVGWLGLFMISLSFTAIIMSEFEHILSQEVELAFFVPRHGKGHPEHFLRWSRSEFAQHHGQTSRQGVDQFRHHDKFVSTHLASSFWAPD